MLELTTKHARSHAVRECMLGFLSWEKLQPFTRNETSKQSLGNDHLKTTKFDCKSLMWVFLLSRFFRFV